MASVLFVNIMTARVRIGRYLRGRHLDRVVDRCSCRDYLGLDYVFEIRAISSTLRCCFKSMQYVLFKQTFATVTTSHVLF